MYELKYYRLNENEELNNIKRDIENFISQNIKSRYCRIDMNIKFDEMNTHLLVYFGFTLYYNSIEEKVNQKNNKEKIKEYIKNTFKEFNYKFVSSEIINHDTYEENILIFTKECSFEFLRINDIINMLKNRVFDINTIHLLNDFILEKKHNNTITYINFSRYYRSYNFDKSNMYGIRLTLTEFLPYENNKAHGKYIFKFIYGLNRNNEVSVNIRYEDRKNSIELSIISNKDTNKYVDCMKITYKDKYHFYTTENNLTAEDFIHHVKKEIETYMFNNLTDFIQGNKKMKYLITRKHVIKNIINTIKVCNILT